MEAKTKIASALSRIGAQAGWRSDRISTTSVEPKQAPKKQADSGGAMDQANQSSVRWLKKKIEITARVLNTANRASTARVAGNARRSSVLGATVVGAGSIGTSRLASIPRDGRSRGNRTTAAAAVSPALPTAVMRTGSAFRPAVCAGGAQCSHREARRTERRGRARGPERAHLGAGP